MQAMTPADLVAEALSWEKTGSIESICPRTTNTDMMLVAREIHTAMNPRLGFFLGCVGEALLDMPLRRVLRLGDEPAEFFQALGFSIRNADVMTRMVGLRLLRLVIDGRAWEGIGTFSTAWRKRWRKRAVRLDKIMSAWFAEGGSLDEMWGFAQRESRLEGYSPEEILEKQIYGFAKSESHRVDYDTQTATYGGAHDALAALACVGHTASGNAAVSKLLKLLFPHKGQRCAEIIDLLMETAEVAHQLPEIDDAFIEKTRDFYY